MWKTLSIIVVGICSSLLIVNGYMRDKYSIIEDTFIAYILWGLLFSSIVICGLFLEKRLCKKIKLSVVLKAATVIIIILCIFIMGYFVGKSELKIYSDDYIKNEWIKGITLQELVLCTEGEEENLIYIGRNDCNECQNFEKEFATVLEKYEVEAVAYYTNLDRDGNNANYMQNVLDKYNVTEVPCVIVVKNEELLHSFSTNDVKKIDNYYSKFFTKTK